MCSEWLCWGIVSVFPTITLSQENAQIWILCDLGINLLGYVKLLHLECDAGMMIFEWLCLYFPQIYHSS